MMKSKIAISILSLFLLISACTPSVAVPDTSSKLGTSDTNNQFIFADKNIKSIEEETNNQPIFIDEMKNTETIEETEHYKIFSSDCLYYCHIYDEDNDIVIVEGPWPKLPRLSMINDHLVKFTLQAGTGLGTQWGYFYDTKMDVISRTFYSIFDQWDGKVAYGSLNKIIVRDIFDKTKYYQEISSFKESLSEMIDPIKNVEFVNVGKSVKVTYFSGVDYEEVTEIIDLP